MSAAALALALLGALPAPAGDAPPPPPAPSPAVRLSLLAEGTLSGGASEERPVLAAGGRLRLRAGAVGVVVGMDARATPEAYEPRMGTLLLLGPVVAHDLSPRTTAHVALLAGFAWIRLRDYVDGGGLTVVETAAGGRVGLEWRRRRRGTPAFGGVGGIWFTPVVGISATVVRSGHGSDRLRGEWGGTTALLSLTLGAELATPPRDPSGA